MKNNFSLNKFLPLIYIMTVFFILFIIFKLLIFFIPFVIAFGVVYITRPLFNFLTKKLKFNENISNILSIFLFYIFVLTIVIILMFLFINQAISFIKMIVFSKDILINKTATMVKDIILNVKVFEIDFTSKINEYIYQIGSYVASLGVLLLNHLTGVFKKLPFILIYAIVTVMATFLIAKDINKVKKFFIKELPVSWLKKLKLIKENVIYVLINYLKAQMILVTITFFILLIGINTINIFIHKIDYILFTVLIISFIDALPLLGTAPILLPWSLYAYITKQYNLAISIFILYVIILLTRQILEPRIISNNLNLNPLVALISIFIGFKFFGIIGFLLGPILLLIIKIVFENEIKNGFLKTLVGEE